MSATEGIRPHRAESAPDPSQVRSAMLLWDIGLTAEDGPSPMVETVTRTVFNDRPVWRVTHYPSDPADSDGFDFYDVDAETIAPVRSIMRNPGFALELSFAQGFARLTRTEGTDTSVERIPLPHPVWPEGPGTDVLLAALPLTVGYSTQYRMIDRWDGTEASRVKPINLTVTGSSHLTTASGRQHVLEVHLEPPDGSFSIRQHVRAGAPHYAWRVEYQRGSNLLVSQVRNMAIE